MPTKHKLGFGKGTITEYEDGTARYMGSLGPGNFRVRIADISGFSVTKGDKAGEWTLNTSAKALPSPPTPSAMEPPRRSKRGSEPTLSSAVTLQWPLMGRGKRRYYRPTSSRTSCGSWLIFGEGVLTDAEFAAQKGRLLSS